MKNLTIFSLVLSFLVSPLAYASTVGPTGVYGFPQNNGVEELDTLIITAEADGEITEMNGIRFMFEPTFYIRWDKGVIALSASGTAVDNGKVSSTIKPEYNHDKGAVSIPILADLSAGESFALSGLRMRTYDRNISAKPLFVDTNGDYESDFETLFSVYINESVGTSDNTGPWMPENVNYNMTDGKPVITWVHPIDWDYIEMRIKKYSGTNGNYLLVSNTYGLVSTDDIATFTDKYYDASLDNKYVLIPIDRNSREGDEVEVIVLVDEEEVVEEEVVEDIPQDDTDPDEDSEAEESEEDEVSELTRLMNYYNVRYSIKCMPSGVAAAENDSACLWARIDLLYAQEKTGEQLRDFVLSEKDLELMAKRRRWPELRYEANCLTTDEPAPYCSSLEKALDRISYFLD